MLHAGVWNPEYSTVVIAFQGPTIQYTEGGLCQCKHCRTLELSNLALSKVAHGGDGGEGKLMCTKYQIRKFSQWKLANTQNMIDKDWSQVDLIITK